LNRPSLSPLGWALLPILVLAGCAGGAGAGSGAARPGPESAAPGTPRAAANPSDVHFITGMIHHHGQAIVMSALALEHGASHAVRTLAERIHVSQSDEIRIMQLWLSDMGEPVPEPSPTGMRMIMNGVEHDMLMPGMVTPEQMTRLEEARGAEFDRLFLTLMIQHHEGALWMVETLLASHGGGIDDTIYKIASDTFADQGSEIDRMERVLETLEAQR
jgi:uncharacterized protein (DUF305 family)